MNFVTFLLAASIGIAIFIAIVVVYAIIAKPMSKEEQAKAYKKLDDDIAYSKTHRPKKPELPNTGYIFLP